MTNGSLQYKITTGGGFDENNDPVAVTSEWSDPIECWIEANTHSNKGRYADGKFTIAAYTATIDDQPFSADRVQISDSEGTTIGEFAVQGIQRLELAGRIKITLS
jgi:hypothetical protein